MKKYWVTFSIGWQEALEYRTEFFLSLMGWFVRLLISFFIWAAVLNTQKSVGGYDLKSMMVYFFLMQIVIALVFSRIGFQVGEDIHTGDFSQYLTKPISYSLYQIMNELSRNLFKSLIGAALFLSLLGGFFPSFYSGFDVRKLPFIVVALLLGYIMNALISLCIGYTGFWLTDSNRFMYVYFALVTAISGITAPLDLFPVWFKGIMDYLPFSYIFFYPVKIAQADFNFSYSERIIVIQLFYTFLLMALTFFMYKRGVRKYEAVGS